MTKNTQSKINTGEYWSAYVPDIKKLYPYLLERSINIKKGTNSRLIISKYVFLLLNFKFINPININMEQKAPTILFHINFVFNWRFRKKSSPTPIKVSALDNRAWKYVNFKKKF